MKIVLCISLLILSIVTFAQPPQIAQAKSSAEDKSSKAPFPLTQTEKSEVAEILKQDNDLQQQFKAVENELDKILTDPQKIALVEKLQLARLQRRSLSDKYQTLIGSLRQRTKCMACELSSDGQSLIEPPETQTAAK